SKRRDIPGAFCFDWIFAPRAVFSWISFGDCYRKKSSEYFHMVTRTISNAIAPVEVSLQGIFKSFPQDGGRLDVLRDINIVVPAGAFVSIVGPSGSGKSTLLAI